MSIHPFLKAIVLRLVRVEVFDHDDLARHIAREILAAMIDRKVVSADVVQRFRMELAEIAVSLLNGDKNFGG